MSDGVDKTPDWKGYGWDQITVENLVRAKWGDKAFDSPVERATRLLEEAIEVFQAVGGSRDVAAKTVDMVMNKKAGELSQEIAGVGVCLLALCALKEVRLDEVVNAEIARIKGLDAEYLKARHNLKSDLGVAERAE